MRNDDVNEILNRVSSRRPAPLIHSVLVEQTTTPSLNVEEIVNSLESDQNADVSANSIVEEFTELPESIQSIMEQYIVPRSIDDSAEDVQLPEQEARNYEGVIVRDETARFSSAEWFQNAQMFSITLAGIGGIGSWTALLLARLKPLTLRLYDPDIVELVNLAGQLYGVNDVGRPKVSAVCNYLRNNANYYAFLEFANRFDRNCTPAPIAICGFDNMQARSEFFHSWKNTSFANLRQTLFIDGRLTATEFQVFCMTREDTSLMSRYESEFLFDDSEASQEVCSFKQTAYLANMIAGVIVNLYVNFCANLCGSPFKRALPFLTQYNTDMMMFNTQY